MTFPKLPCNVPGGLTAAYTAKRRSELNASAGQKEDFKHRGPANGRGRGNTEELSSVKRAQSKKGIVEYKGA